ncbi:uncharacterized protein LOC110708878 [Chenopodium quinoa]|uniref:uncharacterized protein LOC110708878 n=1 Tax=Chenopodium quinoa TaxID=63459 RepID=UPI000B7920B5|nr:uncharacterized protein LOC110708878 [Chenopodium quinoa]
MSLLCWNCRGVGNPWTVQRLRKWSRAVSPDLVFISETKIGKEAVESIKGRIGYTNAFGVACRGKSGGLCLFWSEEEINFALVSFSQNHICGDVMKGGDRWRFVGMYGWPESGNKYQTWKLIQHLCDEASDPIVFGGDFNEILSFNEIEGGASRERREIGGFREALDSCELRDLGFKGQWWTWERGRKVRTRVRERLDRFVASSSWMHIYPRASVEHLLKFCSDHAPIVLKLTPKAKKRQKRTKSFKFETAWLFDNTCETVVREAWHSDEEYDVLGKLGATSVRLAGWSKDKFDALGKQIEEAEFALKLVQQERITEESCDRSAHLEQTLDDLHRKYEAYWFLRSQVLEVRDSDKNTSYYHHKASHRREKKNTIEGLYDDEGV